MAPLHAVWAVSCTTQSQMTEAERDAIAKTARELGTLVQNNDVPGLKVQTIPSVVERFDPIAAAVEAASPLIQRGVITVEALYSLDSTDVKTIEDQTQFFCGGTNSHEVVLTIPQVPPGKYALAILHATGVPQPQTITFLMATDRGNQAKWMLAGAFIHGLKMAGNDGIWYWSKARDFAAKKQNWNSYFYYQTAANLLNPVYFLSSPNLDKLLKEQAAIAPKDLPGTRPMPLAANGQTFAVTDLHTDGSLGTLDLVINYDVTDTSDPVATRNSNLEVMKAMLAQHPELRQGFHGLWAYANAPNERPFANELSMEQIK